MKESEATYQETTYQDLSKRRAAADEGEEKVGALGHDYDILLHFAISQDSHTMDGGSTFW